MKTRTAMIEAALALVVAVPACAESIPIYTAQQVCGQHLDMGYYMDGRHFDVNPPGAPEMAAFRMCVSEQQHALDAICVLWPGLTPAQQHDVATATGRAIGEYYTTVLRLVVLYAALNANEKSNEEIEKRGPTELR
jgi:hypothetical protein